MLGNVSHVSNMVHGPLVFFRDGITEEDIVDVFSQYGNIIDLRIYVYVWFLFNLKAYIYLFNPYLLYMYPTLKKRGIMF